MSLLSALRAWLVVVLSIAFFYLYHKLSIEGVIDHSRKLKLILMSPAIIFACGHFCPLGGTPSDKCPWCPLPNALSSLGLLLVASHTMNRTDERVRELTEESEEE